MLLWIIVENCFGKSSLNSSYFGYNVQLVLSFYEGVAPTTAEDGLF